MLLKSIHARTLQLRSATHWQLCSILPWAIPGQTKLAGCREHQSATGLALSVTQKDGRNALNCVRFHPYCRSSDEPSKANAIPYTSVVLCVTDKNNLAGSLPNELRAMPTLQYLDFYANSLGGTLPTVLNEFPQLTFLDVENNRLTGPAFVNITGLTKLASYRVSDNGLTGSVPELWWPPRKPSALKELWFAHNKLVGAVPTTIGVHTQLRSLILYSNGFTGKLPSELGKLRQLDQLQAYDNFFTSTIPSELYTNTLLRDLRLDMNSLTGTLSSSIGDLSELRDLRIGANAFSGRLPPQIAKLSNLSKFHGLSAAKESPDC